MANVEFFWDPVCPFAWITSRWLAEVAEQRALDVRWRPISLRILNESHYDDPDMAAKETGHAMGLQLLRVATAVEEAKGNDAMGPLYTAFGQAFHLAPDHEAVVAAGASPLAEAALADCGLAPELAAAAQDQARDAAIRESTQLALDRVGGEVGTPIITFGAPDGPTFFGPVMSQVPRGPAACELWDAVETIALHPSFAELKRSLREPPQVAS